MKVLTTVKSNGTLMFQSLRCMWLLWNGQDGPAHFYNSVTFNGINLYEIFIQFCCFALCMWTAGMTRLIFKKNVVVSEALNGALFNCNTKLNSCSMVQTFIGPLNIWVSFSLPYWLTLATHLSPYLCGTERGTPTFSRSGFCYENQVQGYSGRACAALPVLCG